MRLTLCVLFSTCCVLELRTLQILLQQKCQNKLFLHLSYFVWNLISVYINQKLIPSAAIFWTETLFCFNLCQSSLHLLSFCPKLTENNAQARFRNNPSTSDIFGRGPRNMSEVFLPHHLWKCYKIVSYFELTSLFSSQRSLDVPLLGWRTFYDTHRNNCLGNV